MRTPLLLRRVNVELELLRFQLRLARDLNCLSLDSFDHAARVPLSRSRKLVFIGDREKLFEMELLDLQVFNRHDERLFARPAVLSTSASR